MKVRKLRERKNNFKHRKVGTGLKLFYLLVLTLIVTEVSMARYKTSIAGYLNGNAADWTINVNQGTQNFTIDLAQTVQTSANFAYDKKVLAPSAKGSFDILLDCSNCDVALDYEITISMASDTYPEELYIYSLDVDPNRTSILDNPITGFLSLDDMETDATVPITIDWIWQINTEQNESLFEGQNVTLNITVVAKQHV